MLKGRENLEQRMKMPSRLYHGRSIYNLRSFHFPNRRLSLHHQRKPTGSQPLIDWREGTTGNQCNSRCRKKILTKQLADSSLQIQCVDPTQSETFISHHPHLGQTRHISSSLHRHPIALATILRTGRRLHLQGYPLQVFERALSLKTRTKLINLQSTHLARQNPLLTRHRSRLRHHSRQLQLQRTPAKSRVIFKSKSQPQQLPRPSISAFLQRPRSFRRI